MGLRDATNRRWGIESTKLLGMLNLPWQGFEKKTFTKIESHSAMAEQLVRYLAIEEDLQEEIKDTLEQNYQSYDEWRAQIEKRKNNTPLFPDLI